MVRAVFMGSDTFSLSVLERLAAAGPGLSTLVEVIGLVTQPDRPAGRGRALRASPIRAFGTQHTIPVLQPSRLRDADALAQFRLLRPELVVVASFGQILPRAVLDEPEHGCLNLHPSLLPKYRGASPISAPILAGDSVTGTTLMSMAARMDAGPILAQRESPIAEAETAGELERRLAAISGDVLVELLPDWLNGRIQPTPQNDDEATYTERVSRADGEIDWSDPAEMIARKVRAYNPWPVASTQWSERRLRLLRAVARSGDGAPGAVLGLDGDTLLIGTGDGVLGVTELQLAGGRPAPPPTILRGHPDLAHAQLGRG
jgi:methionyl-tRNA formyltransferase